MPVFIVKVDAGYDFLTLFTELGVEPYMPMFKLELEIVDGQSPILITLVKDRLHSFVKSMLVYLFRMIAFRISYFLGCGPNPSSVY